MPHVIGTNWLNQNQFRDYPFTEHTQPRALPTELIVDFGAVLPFGSRTVWLSRIERVGDVVTFTFACTVSGYTLSFTRDLTDAEHLTTWETTGTTEGCEPHPVWFGFLTTGQLGVIASILPTDDVVEFDEEDWLVEPATVQQIDPGGVESINLANYDRTYTNPAPGCDMIVLPPSGALVIGARCLTGSIEFVEGFNAIIRQSTADSRLTFMAQRGEGAGMPCEEIATISNSSISLSPFLSGGPRCEDLIRTVNGVGGPHVQVTGAKGVDVYQHPSLEHILVIDFTGKNAANCVAALEADTTSSSSSSSEH